MVTACIDGEYKVVSVTHRPLDKDTAKRFADSRRRQWQSFVDARLREMSDPWLNPFMNQAASDAQTAYYAHMAQAQQNAKPNYGYYNNAMYRQAQEARKSQEEAMAAARARQQQERHNMQQAHERQRETLEEIKKTYAQTLADIKKTFGF